MKLWEKLERLMRLSSKAAIAREAGLSPTTIHNIFIRKSDVTSHTAMALARVLGVDVGWLVDDSKGWPPARIEDSNSAHAA